LTFTETDPVTLAYTGTTTRSNGATPGTMAASAPATNLTSAALLLARMESQTPGPSSRPPAHDRKLITPATPLILSVSTNSHKGRLESCRSPFRFAASGG
jgi:hypothetical protein